MTCTSTCRKPNGNQAHCAAAGCHQTFAGITGFDHHRVGPVGQRVCMGPAERGMHLNARGVWSMPGGNAYWDRAQSSDDTQTAESPLGVVLLGSGTPEAAETISGGGA